MSETGLIALGGTEAVRVEDEVATGSAGAQPRETTTARARALLARVLESAGWALVGAGVVVGMWQLAALRSSDLAAPSEAFSALGHLISRPFYDNGPNDKGIGLQLATSLVRVFKGFGLAALAGIPLGLAIGASRRAWQAINPVVQVLRPVSPLAWFPLWLVVLKDAGRASVFVIFITALWPTVLNAAAGAASIPRDQRNVARVFRFGRPAYIRHVLVPHALPSIITGLRLSMGIAWMVIVAVEMLSGGSGIGFFVWDSYNASRLDLVIAAIMLIGTVGLLLDQGFAWLFRRTVLEEVGA